MLKNVISKTTAYIVCSFVLNESILYFTGNNDKSFAGYLIVLFFTLFASLLISGLLWLIRKLNIYRLLAIAITLVFSFITCAEFCINNSFGFYLSIRDMLQTAGNAATGFTDNFSDSIKGNLHIFYIILCPTIIYIYAWIKKLVNDKRRNNMPCFILMLSSVTCLSLSFLIIAASGKFAVYREETNFDTSVRNYGLISALRINALRSENTVEMEPVSLEQEEFFLPTPTPMPTVVETTVFSEETGAPVETTPSPTPTPIQYHDCGLDFNELAENESNSVIKSMDTYVASLTPAPYNEYTGIFEGYNLIFITAEAFSREAIIPELMPMLNQMYQEGIHFENYYQPAWGGSTSTGEFSNLIGLMPTDCVNSMMRTRYDNMYYTLGNQLRRLNYFSAGYHNNDYKYYNRHQTHCNLGYDTWTGYWNGLEDGLTLQWPESDLEMIDYTVPMYVDKEPFSIYYMSVSGHCTYHKGSNAMAAKNFEYVENMDCSNTIKCYYAANLEFEFAMESLVKQLDEAGVLDHTLIVIAPDHYPYGLDNSSTWGNTKDYLSELYGYSASDCFLRDHSVLIMWTPALEDMDITVSDPVFSLDIVPTVSNLMGLDYDSRLLVGRDVFSNDTPIIFWPNKSWMTNIGSYNASSGKFTFAEGIEMDDEQKKSYIDTINSIVKSRVSFSGNVVYNDYYGALFGKIEG